MARTQKRRQPTRTNSYLEHPRCSRTLGVTILAYCGGRADTRFREDPNFKVQIGYQATEEQAKEIVTRMAESCR